MKSGEKALGDILLSRKIPPAARWGAGGSVAGIEGLLTRLAILVGVKPAAALRAYKQGGPLAQILRALFDLPKSGGQRGRKRKNYLRDDYLLMLCLQREGLEGDALWVEAAKRAGRNVSAGSMKRYYQIAQREIREIGLGWFFS